MSGEYLAYQLRPNKAVDRQLFVDLLTRATAWSSLEDHTYVGLGGPFLQDFKLLHAQFGIGTMVSLEIDAGVNRRQLFNQPHTCMDCRQSPSGEFVENYDLESNAIIWLDYADESQRRLQLQELAALLPKLRPFDIIRVTMNAAPKTLGANHVNDPDDRNQSRLVELQSQIGDFLPNLIVPEDMEEPGLARVLGSAASLVASQSMNGQPHALIELAAYAYKDSTHQMLTFTGVVLPADEKDAFLERTRIGAWDLASKNWETPLRIKVPVLSLKERQYLDAQLPSANGDDILGFLDYPVANSDEEHEEALRSYARYYRHYPTFLRVEV